MSADSISRRRCVKTLAGAVAAAPLIHAVRGLGQTRPAAESGTRASVTVLLGESIRAADGKHAVIEPTVHGHFVEHLGTVVYDGIWVGENSKVPHIGGIRKALVESLRRIRPPVIRYPGGCFADAYHWRDGIGPRTERPRRFGRWGDVAEPNWFGTHEFVRFCRLTGAEPYLAGNVGTGTAGEFQQWIEYCNAPAGDPRVGTTLGGQRARQEADQYGGGPEPFRVRFWGIGNESWDCGGKFTPEDYCTQYRRFATWLPGYGVPLFPIAAGPNGNDVQWTKRFFKKWTDYSRAPLAGWAPHYYCGTSGTATEFTTDQWYTLLEQASRMEPLVNEQWAALAEADPGHAIRLCVDEWGCWHPADPAFPAPHMYAQTSTLRDALVAALTLDIFHRHAEKVFMSNVAQLVNCLHSLYVAQEDKLVETTNYHVYDLYRPHQGGMAVPIRVEAEPVKYTRDGQPASLFRVAGSASVRDRTVTLTLVHAHASEPLDLEFRWRGGAPRDPQGMILTQERLNAANTFADPTQVTPSRMDVQGTGETWTLHLEPASIVRIQAQVGV